jgi:guanylate kinase
MYIYSDVKGAILVLSGPSGSGKSSLCKELFKSMDKYYFSISTTTREPREGEVDGVDYFFVSKEQFKADIEKGYFLEWAEVHGNYYGTSMKPVLKALEDEKIVIFDIDVQGFDIIKEKVGNLCTSVFITTPTLGDLKSRLISRGTDSTETIEKRLTNAKVEMQHINSYDYLIINDDFDEALSKLKSIVNVCKDRGSMQDTQELISSWSR